MNVVFVVYPEIVLLDLVGPLQVFTHARKDARSRPAYLTNVVSYDGGSTRTNTILPIDSEPMENWLVEGQRTPIHTLVVVGGGGAAEATKNLMFVDQVKQLAVRA
ncbi:MAG: AraC family transcriptional regulator, partial [Pseudomonadota bacterium]